MYNGAGVFSVTAATAGRRTHLTATKVVTLCLDALKETERTEGMRVLAYCFMPDHLHLLVEGSEGSNLISFMKRFKQLSAYRFKRENGSVLWQKGYYDHIMRVEEDVVSAARYIFENPVRAGLVENFVDWPSSGGALFEPFKWG